MQFADFLNTRPSVPQQSDEPHHSTEWFNPDPNPNFVSCFVRSSPPHVLSHCLPSPFSLSLSLFFVLSVSRFVSRSVWIFLGHIDCSHAKSGTPCLHQEQPPSTRLCSAAPSARTRRPRHRPAQSYPPHSFSLQAVRRPNHLASPAPKHRRRSSPATSQCKT